MSLGERYRLRTDSFTVRTSRAYSHCCTVQCNAWYTYEDFLDFARARVTREFRLSLVVYE